MTRATPAITVEMLGAGYGDSLLLTCATPRGPWRALIDTGPDECWPALRERLAALPPTGAGTRRIDLAVVTHIDHDHIGAAAALFSDRTLGLCFDDVWFNAPRMPGTTDTRGVAEGESLAALLGACGAPLPWNRAWHGRPAVAPGEGGFVELPVAAGAPRLTLLSPSPASLARLFKVWDRERARLARPERPAVAPAPCRGGPPDLETLAAARTPTDRAPANGSSIALLLEHRGASILLAADAHPTVLLPALKALAAHRRVSLPWSLDAIKLSHHGSRANVTVGTFEVVQARHHLVSTNGAIFGHPDDEAIARTILHGGRGHTLWFNYRTDRTDRWCDPALRQRHGYEVRQPADAACPGLTIALPARAAA